MEITAITSKSKTTFLATVVGKPPLKINIWDMQQRNFFAIIKTTAPDLIDYYMPENGVFS